MMNWMMPVHTDATLRAREPSPLFRVATGEQGWVGMGWDGKVCWRLEHVMYVRALGKKATGCAKKILCKQNNATKATRNM